MVLEAALLAELARVRPAELERGVNLVGPHRDDLELRSRRRCRCVATPAMASRWSAALALRLGSYELLRGDDGRRSRC